MSESSDGTCPTPLPSVCLHVCVHIDESDGDSEDEGKPREKVSVQYSKHPAVQFACALYSFLLHQALGAVDLVRKTHNVDGVHLIRTVADLAGKKVRASFFQKALDIRSAAWHVLHEPAPSTTPHDTLSRQQLYDLVTEVRGAIRTERALGDRLQLKAKTRAKYIALAESKLTAQQHVLDSIRALGLEQSLKEFASITSGDSSRLVSSEASSTRHVCRVLSSCQSLPKEELHYIERVWIDAVRERVKSALESPIDNPQYV